MKRIFAVCILCTIWLVACTDHSLAPATSELSLENFRSMKAGSYWVYAQDGGFTTSETDSLVCVGIDSHIKHENQAAFVLVEFDDSRKPVDTLYWVVTDHQLWEYNTHFYLGLDSNCQCGYMPYVSWRLLYDTKSDNVQLFHKQTDQETLPALVRTEDGRDTLRSVTTVMRSDNGMKALSAQAPDYPESTPALKPSSMRVCKSGVDMTHALIEPRNVRLAVSGDTTAFVRDSVQCAMSAGIDGAYMLQRSRIVNIGGMLSTIGARKWLMRYKIIK